MPGRHARQFRSATRPMWRRRAHGHNRLSIGFLLALAVALALLFAASLAKPATNPPEETGAGGPLVIGVSNAQSGSSAFLGQRLVEGSRAYFNLVNSRGGIGGRPIKLIVEDDGYEPGPALRNTDDLIRKQHVLFLFDYVGTPTLTRTLPLLRYHAGEQFLNLGPFTGAEPQRHPPYDRFVFSVRASYRDEARALVDQLWSAGFRRIGLLEQADSYGKSGEIAFEEALNRHGLTLVSRATYRRNSSLQGSMKQQVEILKRARVDAIVTASVYEPCAAFIRDLRLGRWHGPVANLSFVGADILLGELERLSRAARIDLTADLITAEVVPNPSQTAYPIVRLFRSSVPVSEYGFVQLEGWLNATIAVEALRRSSPRISRARIATALESMHDWDPGLGCKLGFSAQRHEGFNRVWLYRSDHGHWTAVGKADL